MTTKKEPAETVLVTLICTGYSRDGKTIYWFETTPATAEAGEMVPDNDKVRSYSKKSAKKWGGLLPRAGWVYQVEEVAETPGTIYPATLRTLFRFGDNDQVIEWQAADDANRRVREGQAEVKRDDWRDGLDPIREAYRATRGAARVQLLARIVAYITGA